MKPIDFTNLKISSLPLNLTSLQNANTIPQKGNEVVQNVILVVLIGSIVALAYKIYKEAESNKQIE